jgi:hypothetical protein
VLLHEKEIEGKLHEYKQLLEDMKAAQ